MLGHGLGRKLIATTVASTGALILAVLIIGDPIVEHRVRARQLGVLERITEDVAARLADGAPPDQVADNMSGETGARITIFSPRRGLLGDSAGNPPSYEGVEVDADFLDRTRVIGLLHSESAEEARLRVGRRLDNGVIVVAQLGPDRAAAVHGAVRDLVIVLGVLMLLLAMMAIWIVTESLLEPIGQLTEVARALARGDRNARTRGELPDELGEIGRAIDGMADELDARHRSLQAEEGRLGTVLDSMGEAVFVTDSRGIIVRTNPSLDKLFGEEGVGYTITELVRNPELTRAVGLARMGSATGVEFETSQGERRSLDGLITPLPNKVGVVGVLHDVTKLKRIDRIRRDFVANASHELRTPLTAIRGYAETIRATIDSDPESAKRFLDVVLRHALRLQNLIDDLASLSRAESPDQHFSLSPVDVTAVAAEVVRGLEGQARERDLQLILGVPEGDTLARSNERALDQILVNLVDNAIKYTPAGGSVRVDVSLVGARVEIAVRNSGPGIPPQHLERIFERFYRVDPGRSREVGGTGLGLSIVKHLSQRVGAEVRAESQLDQGACFRLFLPKS